MKSNFENNAIKPCPGGSKGQKDINITEDFDKIPEAPTVIFNEDQAKHLVTSLTALRSSMEKYGIVKIILPENMKPRIDMTKTNRKLFVRQQILSQLPNGKPFVNVEDAYDYEEFKEFLNEIEDEYVYGVPEMGDKDLRAEKEYWKVVHGILKKDHEEEEEDYTVEYGSDLPLDHYQADVLDKESERVSLSRVSKMDDSLLQIIKTKSESISGIVVPWVYVGGHFSTFCWHTEDLFLYSVNFMHEGGTKTWYGVPYEDVGKVRSYMREKYKDRLGERPSLLNEVLINFSPLELVKRGGEMIVTFPGAYHGGFSNSFNLAEAVNLATADWIETAWKFKEMDKKEGYLKRTCFPVDWIIFESFKKRFQINLSDNSRKILGKEFTGLIKREIANRKKARNSKEIKDEILFNGDKIKYFDYTCETCKNYLYLSWVGCSSCHKIYCLDHEEFCNCPNSELLMFKRNEDGELTAMVAPGSC